MLSFWYWHIVFDNFFMPHRHKMLLVTDTDHVEKGLYDLTQLGCEGINTWEEFQALFPPTYYPYNNEQQ